MRAQYTSGRGFQTVPAEREACSEKCQKEKEALTKPKGTLHCQDSRNKSRSNLLPYLSGERGARPDKKEQARNTEQIQCKIEESYGPTNHTAAVTEGVCMDHGGGQESTPRAHKKRKFDDKAVGLI